MERTLNEDTPMLTTQDKEAMAIEIAGIAASKYRTPFNFEELRSVAFLGIWSTPRENWGSKVASYFYTRAHGAIKDFLRREISDAKGVTQGLYRRNSQKDSRLPVEQTIGIRSGHSRFFQHSEEGEKELNLEDTLASNEASPEVLYLAGQVCRAAAQGAAHIEEWDEPALDGSLAETSEKVLFRLLESQRARYFAAEKERRRHFDPRKDIDQVVAHLLQKMEKRGRGMALVAHTYRPGFRRRRKIA